jgi:beta-N-acetylhexosaminidase
MNLTGCKRPLAALLIAAVLLSGCDLTTPNLTPSPTTGGTPAASLVPPPSGPSATATAQPTTTPSCATVTFESLTDAQRIGQLFVIGLIKDRLDATERTAIADLHFGSMAFTTQTSIGAAAVRRITDAVQSLATPANTRSVRFFIAANQEGGLIQGLSGPGFERIPSALDQGSMAPSVLRQKAGRWGRQLAAAGVNFNFAPVADVVPPGTDDENAPIGQLEREFGHDPDAVASHVSAFIAGMRTAGIATSAKHFPGLGRVAGNTDFTSGVVDDVTTRDDPFIEPFVTAITRRVPFVMVSLATYDRIDPAHLAAFSKTVITGMLRGDLGYRGVVISDAIGGTAAVKSIPPADRAIDFLTAGGDMIISNQAEPATAMAHAIAARASTDDAFRKRVDDAVRHVLQAKDQAGLLPCSG